MSRTRAGFFSIALALLSSGFQPHGAIAQQAISASTNSGERTVLIKMLEDGRSFRVRARAASALARFTDNDVLVALEGALRDSHEAVRTAAAHSLAAVGARRSVSALRGAARDSSTTVANEAKAALASIATRSGSRAVESAAIEAAVSSTGVLTRLRRAQHVVVIGEMTDRTPAHSQELSKVLSEQVAVALTKLDRVAVLRPDELQDEDVLSAIADKKLPVLRLEGNVQSVQNAIAGDERRVRCEVSVLLLDEGSRALRSMLRGAASAVAQVTGAPAQQERELTRKALRGAVQTAMSSATDAIIAGAAEVADSDAGVGQAYTQLTPRRARPRRSQ